MYIISPLAVDACTLYSFTYVQFETDVNDTNVFKMKDETKD